MRSRTAPWTNPASAAAERHDADRRARRRAARPAQPPPRRRSAASRMRGQRRRRRDRLRVDLHVQDRRLARRQRALEGGRELLRLLDRLAVAAEGARLGGEIGIAQLRRADAAGIFALLMHADRAVHAVVDHDDDDIGRSYCTAVANSCPFIRKSPSPAKADDDALGDQRAWRRSPPARRSPSSPRPARAAG